MIRGSRMDRKEAEEFVYRSYLRAAKYHSFSEKDAVRRHPEYTKALLERKSGTPAVVVTGSKGKGSVAKMLSEILETRYRVGLMTGPHLLDFCERFQVNGEKVSSPLFSMLMEEIRPEIEKIEETIPKESCISPMGIQADFALSYFQEQHTEWNILECGKGAKFDDVNNVLHDYAIINSVFLEHRRELGESISEIAEDKAHVITGREKAAFVGKQTEEALTVIQERAKRLAVPLYFYGKDFWEENLRYTKDGLEFDLCIFGEQYRKITLPLFGAYQARNCALAFATAKRIFVDFQKDWKEAEVRKKLASIRWPGRLELLSKEPFVLLDSCIHRVSCKEVKEVLEELHIRSVLSIIAIPVDKDYLGVLEEMKDISERIFLSQSRNPHYHFGKEQLRCAAEKGIKAEWKASFSEAFSEAKRFALPIVILGTTSFVAEVEQFRASGIIFP